MLVPTKKISNSQRQLRSQRRTKEGCNLGKNKILFMPGGQPTYWKTIIPQMFSYRNGSSEPNETPSWGSDNRGGTPEDLALKARRVWVQGFHLIDGITDSIDMSLRKLWELVMDSKACSWGHKESDMTKRLNWANRNSTLGGHTQGLLCTKTQGNKSSNFIRDWARPAC